MTSVSDGAVTPLILTGVADKELGPIEKIPHPRRTATSTIFFII
jgi:hypothetical protein